jgi:hypothetical protein
MASRSTTSGWFIAVAQAMDPLNLLPPAVPELGEAVQQDNQRAFPGLDVVESLAPISA